MTSSDRIERLRASEEAFARVFDLAPLCLAISSLETGAFLEINDAFVAVSGYRREEVLGKTSLDLGFWVDDEERAAGRALLESVGSFREQEVRLRTKSGEVRTFLLSAEVMELDGRSCIVNAAVDITGRERSAAQVSRLGRILEDSLNEIYLFDADTLRFTLVNQGGRSNLGYTMAEMEQLTPLDLKPEFDLDRFEALLRPLRAGRTNMLQFDTVHRRKDGSLYPVEVHLQLFREEEPPQFAAIILDTTERQQAEVILRASELRFRGTFENAAVGIAHVGTDGRWLRVNQRLCDIVGYRRDEMLQRTFQDITHPDDLEVDVALTQAILRGERRRYQLEKRYFHHSGEVIWVLLSVSAVYADDATGEVDYFIAVVEDISARKAAEFTLRELSETLEARVQERTRQVQDLAIQLTLAEVRERSRLAQVLHDDLQQQLYAVQFVLRDVARAAEGSEAVLTHVEQARSLVREALEVSRATTANLSPPVLADEGLVEALEWLGSFMRDRYELEVAITVHLPLVRLDESVRVLLFNTVRELLFNIVKHAGVSKASISLREIDGRLEICVSDSGRGFDQDAPSGDLQGTGLGLSGMHKRLQLFGGSLAVASRPGEGTRITIEMPLAALGER